MTSDEFEYDVALSFAGEDRMIVEKFAKLLKARDIKVFYDEYEAADLWGKDLVDHLAEIYSKKARYCAMFISHNYPLKKWTKLERKYAQERAFRDANEYILPIRLDDTEVPGITETTGYRDIRQHSMESIVSLLEQKLAKAKGQDHPSLQRSVSPFFSSIPMPNRKRTFNQLEKDRFAKEAFNYIKQYFQQALRQLESSYSDIQTDFTERSTVEFMGKIYIRGNLFRQCQIWLGDDRSSDTIYYNEGFLMSSAKNSFNDYLPVESDGEELRLHIGNMAIGAKVEEPLATKENAAQYLWERITSYLESR